jgi:hypothetical protein
MRSAFAKYLSYAMVLLVGTPGLARADTQETIGIGVGVLVGWLILMLIIREIVCWYYKINQNTTVLREILEELRALNTGAGSASSRGAVPADPAGSGGSPAGNEPEDAWS